MARVNTFMSSALCWLKTELSTSYTAEYPLKLTVRWLRNCYSFYMNELYVAYSYSGDDLICLLRIVVLRRMPLNKRCFEVSLRIWPGLSAVLIPPRTAVIDRSDFCYMARKKILLPFSLCVKSCSRCVLARLIGTARVYPSGIRSFAVSKKGPIHQKCFAVDKMLAGYLISIAPRVKLYALLFLFFKPAIINL